MQWWPLDTFFSDLADFLTSFFALRQNISRFLSVSSLHPAAAFLPTGWRTVSLLFNFYGEVTLKLQCLFCNPEIHIKASVLLLTCLIERRTMHTIHFSIIWRFLHIAQSFRSKYVRNIVKHCNKVIDIHTQVSSARNSIFLLFWRPLRSCWVLWRLAELAEAQGWCCSRTRHI